MWMIVEEMWSRDGQRVLVALYRSELYDDVETACEEAQRMSKESSQDVVYEVTEIANDSRIPTGIRYCQGVQSPIMPGPTGTCLN